MKNKKNETNDYDLSEFGAIPYNAQSSSQSPADYDLSEFGAEAYNQPITVSQGTENLKQLGEAIQGGGLGLFQGASDVGANVGHFPSEAYTYFTGKPGYDTPKPNFRESTPSSETGQQFEKGGEFLAPLIVSPTLAAEATLGKAMYGGRMLPRLLSDMLGGAAEGETGERGTSALLGAAAPALGRAKHWITSVPKTKNAAVRLFEKVRNASSKEGDLGIPVSVDFLRNLQYQLQSHHLKPSKMQINTLLGEAAKGDYPSYHALQSALGDISRELKHPEKEKASGILGMLFNNGPQSTASERLTGNQVENLRKQYISEALQHLNKTGKGKIADLEQKARSGYHAYMKSLPLRNKVILGASAGLPGYELIKHFLGK